MIYLSKFKLYLQSKGYSDNTIDNYINYVQMYVNWYEKNYNKPFYIFRSNSIEKYSIFLLKTTTKKSASVNITGLRSFEKFLLENGIQPSPVIHKNMLSSAVVSQDKPHENFNDAIDESKIENFRRYVCSNEIIRNYAIVTIMAYAGLKLTECINLTLNDIDFDNKIISIYGTFSRIIPMDSKVEESLKLYLMERDYDDYSTEYLFSSKRDKRLHRTTVNKIFEKYKSFGISTQTLRNFYCIRLKNQGFSNDEIFKLAGLKQNTKYLKTLLQD